MTSSGLPLSDAAGSNSRFDALADRRTSGRVLALPPYDIRVRRELAHRRFYRSAALHIARVAGLHLLDAVALALSVAIASALVTLPDARALAPAVICVALIGLNATGAYRPGAPRRELKRIVLGMAIAVGTLVVVVVLPPHADLPVPFLAVFGLLSVLMITLDRYAVELGVRQAYAHGIGLRRAVIVGRHADVEEIIAGLRTSESLDQRVVGYVSPSRVHDANALGTIDQLDAILDREDPSELIITSSLSADMLRGASDACFRRGIQVLVVPWWSRAIRGWAEPVRIGQMPGYHVHPLRPAMPAMMLKRGTDVVFTCIGLVFAAPLMLLIAAAIKLDSRGPVFFRQRRVGLGGREFMMWKFRSMQEQAEAEQAKIAHLNRYPNPRLFKLRNDPRITRVGKVLRRFSLDELPQLLNVLAGEMSLVGPRPPLPAEVGRYEPRHFVRLSVVPGLTGPWQVGGRNLIEDFEEIVRMERNYVDGWSLSMDLAIMAKTVGVVISGKGAF